MLDRHRRRVTVGDPADQVVAACGPLGPFCCRSKVATAERGGGRFAVVVPDGTQRVGFIVGGDAATWMRTIED